MVEIVIAVVLASGPPKAPQIAPEPPKVVEKIDKKDAEKHEPAKLTEEAPKPAGGGADTEKTEKDDAPVPPQLTRKALCGEVLRTSKELAGIRKKLDDERAAIQTERVQLEKLKAEITEARAGLRAETEKLEALLAKRGEGGTEPAPAAKTEPTRAEAKPPPPAPKPQDLDALAKTMKSMKPEAAAALIQRSEPQLAAALLRRMKPADAGAVMDRLKPELAADLLTIMSTLSTTPAKGGRP
ncbi:MAG: hypothetical protein ACOZQL_06315 [Myxococcota bacterium]